MDPTVSQRNCGFILVFQVSDLGLQSYEDADMAGYVDGRKSTTRYIYTLGGMIISWVSKLQKIVTLSITKYEYISVTKKLVKR